jgi:hypothetical protein
VGRKQQFPAFFVSSPARAGAGVRFAASDTTDFNLNMHQFQLGLTYAFD